MSVWSKSGLGDPSVFAALNITCLLVAFACTSNVAWAQDCGPKIMQIPAELFSIKSGLVYSGRLESVDVLASRNLAVEISTRGTNAKAYILSFASPGAPLSRQYCASSGGIGANSSEIVNIKNAPLGLSIVARITNVGAPGEQSISYRMFGDVNPDWNLTAQDLVRRKLYVFVFENAPLAGSARARVDAALQIWRSVGIDFEPIYRFIGGTDVKNILGDDRMLQGFFGPTDKDVGEWQDRERVQNLKPRPDAFGVFFAKGTHDLIGSTKADAERHQAYISDDVSPIFQPPIGRTVAHELGHLLLGEKHTGDPGAPWTSGLMFRGTESNATDISGSDAKTARNRARQIP